MSPKNTEHFSVGQKHQALVRLVKIPNLCK